jgi:CheY-like chemotaxis protein
MPIQQRTGDRPHILSVGWSHNSRSLVLESGGYEVTQVSPDEALGLLRQRAYKLVILDCDAPDSCLREIYPLMGDQSKIVQLGHLTFPTDLLSLAQNLLPSNLTSID